MTLGDDDGRAVEVLAGLDPSDRVVLRPGGLEDGAKVEVQGAAR